MPRGGTYNLWDSFTLQVYLHELKCSHTTSGRDARNYNNVNMHWVLMRQVLTRQHADDLTLRILLCAHQTLAEAPFPQMRRDWQVRVCES